MKHKNKLLDLILLAEASGMYPPQNYELMHVKIMVTITQCGKFAETKFEGIQCVFVVEICLALDTRLTEGLQQCQL